jgi:hypothetical protein
VDHAVAEDEVLQCLGQRRQAHPADADPLGHARARDVHARARIDFFLPVQRQVVVVLGDHHLREQTRRGDALVDDLRGHRRGLDRLAARAVGLLDLVVMIDARQVRRQRLAHRLAFGPRWRGR